MAIAKVESLSVKEQRLKLPPDLSMGVDHLAEYLEKDRREIIREFIRWNQGKGQKYTPDKFQFFLWIYWQATLFDLVPAFLKRIDDRLSTGAAS